MPHEHQKRKIVLWGIIQDAKESSVLNYKKLICSTEICIIFKNVYTFLSSPKTSVLFKDMGKKFEFLTLLN